MSFPAPDPASGVGQTSRFWPALIAILRWLFRRDSDPLDLIDRERDKLGDRYWPEAEPSLDSGAFLKGTVEMTEKELRWRVWVRRTRDLLSLIALASFTFFLIRIALHAG